MSDLIRFGVAIENTLLEAFDKHLEQRGYENRSEALRDLIRRDLQRSAWDRGEDTVATISIIYDHHVRDLADNLIEIQHEFGGRMLATTHVHLDHDHCLEVILAKGPSGDVKRLADKLIGAKGVIAGEVNGLAIVGAGGHSKKIAAHHHDHHEHRHAPKRKARPSPPAPRARKRSAR